MDNSPVVNLTWQMACIEMAAARSEFIEPEHFLAALTKLKQICSGEAAGALRAHGTDVSLFRSEMVLVADVLDEAGIEPDAFRHTLREREGRGTHEHAPGGTLHRSDRSRRMFGRAEAVALITGAGEIKAGHLFLAILEEKESVGCRMLVENGASLESLAEKTRERTLRLPARALAGAPQVEAPAESSSGTPFLDRSGRDLTREAVEGKLGPIIGRRGEILQVIQTLARRSKNNPVLVGEAGVGKTAIVEAVAIRITEGKDAHVIGGKRLVELTMASLVGGTKYRGEFEERCSRVIEECRTHPEVILFIDELHTLIGAGRGEGSMDAANILKPALARGDVRCIGATTIAEYRRYVESDPALERRFEKVMVPEPSREETLEILRGLRPKLEEHHGARVSDRALEAAVDLSIRFDADHQLPDKAIDLVDKAGARTRVPLLSMRADMTAEVSEEAGAAEPSGIFGEVTDLVIAQVLSEKVGVPLEVITDHLSGMGQSHLLGMETALEARVIGQDEAVGRVCDRLLMAHAGLGQRRGPLAVFLFLGPTGVGKTELARSLAAVLFGSENDMIRLDMSEYMEQHSVAKLIGSPPGYVGHEEEGQLTGKLRTRPYCVVLLDEIEKAHPRVLDMFLQVFDEGRLTDSKGRTADARNAIFIMTSNVAMERQIGFGQDASAESASTVLNKAGGQFRPEFINRIDEQIVFRPLIPADVRLIAEKMLDEIRGSLLARHDRRLVVTDEALEMVTREGYSDEHGLRHLRRTVQRLVEVPVSRLIVSGEAGGWSGIRVAVRDGSIALEPVHL